MIKKISLSLVLTALCASQAQAVTSKDVYNTFLSTRTRKALTLGSVLGTAGLSFAVYNYLSDNNDTRSVIEAGKQVFTKPFNWAKKDSWRIGLAGVLAIVTGYGLYKFFQMPKEDVELEQPSQDRQIAEDKKLAETLATEELLAQEKTALEKETAQQKADWEYAALVEQHGPRKAFEIKHNLHIPGGWRQQLHGSRENYRKLRAEADRLPIWPANKIRKPI